MTQRYRLASWWPWIVASSALSLSCADGIGERSAAEAARAEPAVAQSAGGTRPGDLEVPVTLVDPLAEHAKCPPAEEASLECEWLRSLIVAGVVQDLEAIERARDRRGAAIAISALDIVDEPAIVIAAGRILGEFVETPRLAEKVIPLIDSSYLGVQRIAAELLSRLPDRGLDAIGRKWLDNHSGLDPANPYVQLEFPAHYARMGFPEVRGAQRFTPMDSDRSVGWWSRDPAAAVANVLAEAMGVEPITWQQWSERAQQEQMSTFQSGFDPKKMEEIQKLMEQYVKTQDAKLLERVERLQQELSAPMEQASADAEKAVTYVAQPISGAPADEVFYLIAEEKGGHVARLALVYRLPALERTVVQMTWDLRDYPPAAWVRPETRAL